MGLDQYGYFLKNKPKNEGDYPDEQFYWRKHPNLQGWMANLYQEKTGDPEFNCEYLELDLDDILRLEAALLNTHRNNSFNFIMSDDKRKENPYLETEPPLPSTTGFFFGDESDEEYKEQDFNFVKEAKKALKEGLKVFYYPSW